MFAPWQFCFVISGLPFMFQMLAGLQVAAFARGKLTANIAH